MIRHVVVPLDGSAFAEHALSAAACIARRAVAHLQIVRVHVPKDSLHAGTELFPDPTPDGAAREFEGAYLDGVVKRLAEIVPSRVSRALIDGPVMDSLHDHALAARADLVVIATHGRGPLSRFWLGSVADALVRRLPMPILLLRPNDGPPNLDAEFPAGRILIPLDGSALSEQILEPAVSLGALTESEYVLLQVIESLPPPHLPSSPLLEQRTREARTYLDGVAERMRGQGLRVRARVVSNLPVAGAILEEARAQSADLIAIKTHGRGGMARLFQGSVADKVIRGSTMPVLVHRPRLNDEAG